MSNNAAEFKYALYEGKVEFDYVKTDGTIRHAIGTMNNELFPKVESPAIKFNVEVSKWADADFKPKRNKFKISVTQSEIDAFGIDAMDNVVKTAIKKKFGHGVEEFNYKQIDQANEKPHYLPEDSVFYYDFDKQGFRSFKIAKLKEWKVC